MNQPQSQKSLANVCLFCAEKLNSPSMCTFCGFRFCDEHRSTEAHQCIKTRYSEYIRKTDSKTPPNVSTGNFRVVCDMCGFSTSKGVPIEYAGEELVQHTQIVGCSGKIFLEEVKVPGVKNPVLTPDISKKQEVIKPKQIHAPLGSSKDNSSTSIVDQIIQLSSLKEKGLISDQEFSYMKSELLKKLH